MRSSEENLKRLETYMKKNPRINRAAHLHDFMLCREYLTGNTQPFTAMFPSAHSKLERFVRREKNDRISAQDKEDIIAESIEAAIRRMRQFHGWSLFSTWMIGIARYRILTFIKKQSLARAALSASAYSIAPPQPLQNTDTTVREMLSSLSQTDAAIVRLKAVEQLTFHEIAKHLHIPIKQIAHRYKEALQTLRAEQSL